MSAGDARSAASTEPRPRWDVYAADLAQRLGARDYDFASPFVVGVLGYVVENEDVGVDEFDRKMCKHWLDRLVDEQGNPKDDKGRDAWEAASEENALGHHGTLSSIVTEDDRVDLRIAVHRRVPASIDRAELREKLTFHAKTYVDHLLDALYKEPTDAAD